MSTATEQPPTITFTALSARLEIGRSTLIRLCREGLPFDSDDGKRKLYDPTTVDEWLVKHGHARVEVGQKICRTYAELAAAIGVDIRTVARWATEPGFPGSAGAPGRAEARLPLDDICAWAAAKTKTGYGVGDEEYTALQKQISRLTLEQREREKLTALDRLADVEIVGQFCEQVIANAKAVLEPIPDDILEMMPDNLPPATRRRIHTRAGDLIATALAELARLVEGDDDPENDTD